MSEATYEFVGRSSASRATDALKFNIRATGEDSESWDRFAQVCGATFRGAYWGAFAWQLRHHFAFVLKRYDVFLLESDRHSKVGQFVIGMGRRTRVFGDVLHVLPSYKDLWPQIMDNVLRELGPAVYHYGSDWTTEPARTDSIAGIHGADVIANQPIDVYAVRFSDYLSWDNLHQSLSRNVRRNVTSATRCGTKILVQNSLVHLFDGSNKLLRLKRAMFLRKRIKFKSVRSYIALISRICSLRKYLFTASALKDGQTVSLFSGLQFGRDLYYLEGASINQPGGAAWLLLISMLRSNFEESEGLGTCVLGPDEKEPRDPIAQTAWQNLLHQRLQCSAKPYPTSFVTFRYTDNDGPVKYDDLRRVNKSRRIAQTRLSPAHFDRI